MNNQFSVSLRAEDLANAARFLLSQGSKLRSRNQLVSECVSYLAELARQEGLELVKSEQDATEFLILEGLAGETGKAKEVASTKKLIKSHESFVVDQELLRKAVSLQGKNSFKNNQEALFSTCQGIAREKGEAGFSEVMKLLASSKFAEDEEFQEKVTKLFSKEE